VSHQVGAVLDVEDLMEARYTLEVSSPGLDRRLVTADDFQRFTGSNIKILLKVPRGGRKRFQGCLERIENGEIRLRIDSGEVIEAAVGQIEKANLVPEFGGKFGLPRKSGARK
jgi:ribosome maturation factor RimP